MRDGIFQSYDVPGSTSTFIWDMSDDAERASLRALAVSAMNRFRALARQLDAA